MKKLKRIISLILIISLMLSMSTLADYVGQVDNATEGGDGVGAGAQELGDGCPGGFCDYDLGYRIYFVDRSYTVVSDVIDFLFSYDYNVYEQYLGTTLGNGKVNEVYYITDEEHDFIKYMPLPIIWEDNGDGSGKFYPNGDNFKAWLRTPYTPGCDNGYYLTWYYFDKLDVNSSKENGVIWDGYDSGDYMMIVETIAWLDAKKSRSHSLGYKVYGNVRQLASFLYSNGFGEYGAYTGAVTHDALVHSLETLLSWIGKNEENTMVMSPRDIRRDPSIDYEVGKQSYFDIIPIGNVVAGFGIHMYWKEVKEEKKIPDNNDDDDNGNSGQTQNNNIQIGNSPYGKVELSFNKSVDANLKVDSTQWSVHNRAINASGWGGYNKVLPGGAMFWLESVGKTDVTVETWQSNIDLYEAEQNHNGVAQTVANKLDTLALDQYVDNYKNSDTALYGKVVSPGISLSQLGLNNNAGTDSKYYLREGSKYDAANENDIDVIDTDTTTIMFNMSVTPSTTRASKKINDGAWIDVDGSDNDVIEINAATGCVERARQEACSQVSLLNPEPVVTVSAMKGVSKIEIGILRPEERTCVLDPRLCPIKNGTADIFTKANISQFKIRDWNWYMGDFFGKPCYLSNASRLFISNSFSIPNANVDDID